MPIYVDKDKLLQIQEDMNRYYQTQDHNLLTQEAKRDVGRCIMIVETPDEIIRLDGVTAKDGRGGLKDTAEDTLNRIDERLKKFMCQTVLGGKVNECIMTAFADRNLFVSLNGGGLTYTATQIPGTDSYSITAECNVGYFMKLEDNSILLERNDKNNTEMKYKLEFEVNLASSAIKVTSLQYPDIDKIMDNDFSLFQKILSVLKSIFIDPIVTLFNFIKNFFTASESDKNVSSESQQASIIPDHVSGFGIRPLDRRESVGSDLPSLDSSVDITQQNPDSGSDIDSLESSESSESSKPSPK